MLTLSDLIIRPQEPLRVALERMTKNRHGILFVCDEGLHLIGALSDGDVRRTLLENTLLVAAVSKAMNTDPITAKDVEEAGKLLRRFALVVVPVLDGEGRVREAVLEAGGELQVIRSASPDSAASVAANAGALAIIPARGGSKRVPKKNLAVAGGRSLLAWAIVAAQKARRVGPILVSTDDAEVAAAARACGVEIPWLRPAELAQDHTSSLDVVIHAVQWATTTLSPAPEFAVLLEPTAPFRAAQQIDAAISLLAGSDADSVVSVSEVPHVFNPEELVRIEGGTLRPYNSSRTLDNMRLRGHQEPVYAKNGLVYAFRTSCVLNHKSIYGPKTLPLVTPWEDFMDIDTPRDLQIADFLLKLTHTAEEFGS